MTPCGGGLGAFQVPIVQSTLGPRVGHEILPWQTTPTALGKIASRLLRAGGGLFVRQLSDCRCPRLTEGWGCAIRLSRHGAGGV
jgi:hypothetical protein